MASELAIDTNVFAHCYNPIEPRRDAALALVVAMRDGDHLLCVDEGFHLVEAQNRSLIGHEYVKHLRAGSPGLSLVAFLASRGRIKIVARRPPTDVYRKIKRLISDAGDRAFVCVAWHADARLLVSHDYSDLPQTKRDALRSSVAVEVVDAAEATVRIGA